MYYKATRLDAISFADGETRWVVGEVTSLAEDERRTTLCKPGLLHASREAAESLVGGSWPCRLFEVEPVGKVITSPNHPHKVGAHAWRVVKELPAWQALGPNGEAVANLIERARHLIESEVRRLDSARDSAWAAAWDSARYAARAAALALVVRDLITREHFDMLYGPWASVMEGE